MTHPDAAAEALKNEGNARKSAGDLPGAAECYRRALEAKPDYTAALYNLGVVLQEGGHFSEAEPCFRRCRRLDPGDRDAIYRLGLVLARQGRHGDAAEAYAEALALDPRNPLLWFELARERRALHQGAEAAECASRALEIEPRLADAHNLLGMLLQDEGKLGQALERYRKAVELTPDDPASHNNLACGLSLNGALEEAIPHFQRAIELRPEYAEAHANLGNTYSVLGRRDLALRCYKAAYRLAPGDAAVAASVLFEAQHLCDWSGFEELCEVRRRNIGAGLEKRIDPFSLLPIPSTRREQLVEAQSVARQEQRTVAAERERAGFRFERRDKRRLKLGYLSADLHEHATAHLASGLFELHDRGRFEVCAYSYGPDDGSPMRARLLRAFDRFIDIRKLSHAEAAHAIHRDGVDILVDLKGYTTYARPAIVAMRPAPIQVSYLGYPATMGAEFIDYLVSDAFITPGEHEADYSEKLVLLPGSYQVNDGRRRISATPARQGLGLPQEGFVFCCFNQPYKILPPLFELWMRILKAVPGSVLWLLEFNRWAIGNLRREASARGVEPGRLVAAPMLPLAEHLGRLGAADLFLDTLPCNAHTSASDALWAGLPVLTCPGETFASRVAGSLLKAVGLPELIAGSLAEYEALALRLAGRRAELAALRERLAACRGTAALFDTPAFVRNLEEAYERMWESYAAGRAPARIDLT